MYFNKLKQFEIMCWITSKTPCIQTASENVPVYKVMLIKGFWFRRVFLSYYQEFVYKLRTTYTTEMGEVKSFGKVFGINEGFHSYHSVFTNFLSNGIGASVEDHNLHVLDSYSPDIHGHRVVKVEGYIPKGSKYYINERGECVSEKIKLIKYKKLKSINYVLDNF